MTAPEIAPDVVERTLCRVRDGNFVEPCKTLSEAIENPASAFSKAKGITRWAYTNLKTLEPSREFYGIKSKAHPNGLLFNFCPWCGASISEPFAGPDEALSRASGEVVA